MLREIETLEQDIATKEQEIEDTKADLKNAEEKRDDAQEYLDRLKTAERAASNTLDHNRMDLALNGPYINHEISKLGPEILGLHTEIERLEKELGSKNKELVAKQTRLAEIVAQYPPVKSYMTAFINASVTEGSAFDFDEYIEQYPPLSIIFDSE